MHQFVVTEEGVSEFDRSPLLPNLPTLGFYDFSGGGNEESDRSGSHFNRFEGRTIVSLVDFLKRNGIGGDKIGVIVFYKVWPKYLPLKSKIIGARIIREVIARSRCDCKRDEETV